jgi:hypothetical protein
MNSPSQEGFKPISCVSSAGYVQILFPELTILFTVALSPTIFWTVSKLAKLAV